MPYCVVFNCKSNSNSEDDKSLYWFRFPNGEKHRARRNAWIHYCRRKDFAPTKYSSLCSKHFTSSQYSRNPEVMSQYGYVGAKAALRDDAIPDVPWSTDVLTPGPGAKRKNSATETPRSAVVKRRRLEILQDALCSVPEEPMNREVSTDCDTSPTLIQTDSANPTEQHVSCNPPTLTEKGIQAAIPLVLNTRTRRIQVGKSKLLNKVTDFGVQCTIAEERPTKLMKKKCTCVCNCENNDDELNNSYDTMTEMNDSFLTNDGDIDNSIENDSDFDPNSVSDDDMDMHDSDGEMEEEIANYRLEVAENPTEEKHYIVAESALCELFSVCYTCREPTSAFIDHSKGTMISVLAVCSNGHTYTWNSQPSFCKLPWFNLLLSSAILTSGCNTTKVLRCFEQARIKGPSRRSVSRLQSLYAIPAAIAEFKEQQSKILDVLRAKTNVTLGGDGRCDSPGFSAKYGSYTLMDLEENKVVDIQLVQCNEVNGSTHMELEGLKRGLTYLDEAGGIDVNNLVTDRHVMIKSYMKKERPDVNHYFDVWHVAKGISKKLETAAKRRGGEDIRPWIKSIVNHCYWVAASSSGNKEMVVEKWKSVSNHLVNVHNHDSPLFPKCTHEDLSGEDDREWMKEGSRCHKMIREVIENGYLMRDLPQLSPRHQTYGLEVFHSIVNHFAPKSTHFFYLMMLARLYIAALHFNENGNRAQAKRKDGEERWRTSYPKAKKGTECVVKKCKVPATYDYVASLMDRIVERRKEYNTIKFAQDNLFKTLNELKPDPVSASFDKVDKQLLVESFKSRYF